MSRAKYLRISGLFLLLALASGCGYSTRFDAHSRTACFDSLWNVLDAAYWDAETMSRLEGQGVRRLARNRITQSASRREYLIGVIELLARLEDPHAQCDELKTYWLEQTGQEIAAVFSWMYRAADAYWIAFPEPALVIERMAGAPVQPDRPYELLAVEGVPACVAALALLEAPLGHPVRVTIRDGEGCACELTLVVPLPPPTQFILEPGRRQREAAQPALVRPNPSPIGYARIPGFEKRSLAEAFDRDLSPLLHTDSLLLDLRGNSGGRFNVLSATLGRFLDEPRRIADLELRIPRLLPLGPPTWRVPLALLSFPRRPTYQRPVVVLIDGATGSSAEIAAFALRELVGATLVGERTIGAGAGVALARLPDGLKIRFGSQLIRARDGSTFQGRGIMPDVAVPIDPEDLRRRGRRAFTEWRARMYAAALEAAHGHGAAR